MAPLDDAALPGLEVVAEPDEVDFEVADDVAAPEPADDVAAPEPADDVAAEEVNFDVEDVVAALGDDESVLYQMQFLSFLLIKYYLRTRRYIKMDTSINTILNCSSVVFLCSQIRPRTYTIKS